MADQVVGGAVRVTWDRLRGYVEATRRESGSNKAWEWFQWLAEQLDARRPAAHERGAHVEHRSWRG